ncbi:hypothetical protein E2C01_062006 [Portunus trituberculatus]|uniref:Uncharacterized protein n=1 Tax=Portunus trituberculatus TaxID=210409 RepID=A0A5B7H5C7_PORTR|nr:hypothetical protein [Portunus trituberculatus]
MEQRNGMRGSLWDIPLYIAGPLDMSMKEPPPRHGVNIHLQTPMKVDVYPVPQEGQQEQLEERAATPAAAPG